MPFANPERPKAQDARTFNKVGARALFLIFKDKNYVAVEVS